MSSDTLRHRIIKFSDSTSDSVYVGGISKKISDEKLVAILSIVEPPIEVDLSKRHLSGRMWAKYESIDVVKETINRLNHLDVEGVTLSLRYEMGYDEHGIPIVSKNQHSTIIRKVSNKRLRSGYVDNFTYSNKSINVNEVEYPFPSGVYLSRIIQLTRLKDPNDPLLRILTDPILGNKYPKEISEVMAMEDSLQRAFRFLHKDINSVKCNVYVLGDGVRPLCASCMCLYLPSSWIFFSIDPLMEGVDLSNSIYSQRMNQYRGKSEDFKNIQPLIGKDPEKEDGTAYTSDHDREKMGKGEDLLGSAGDLGQEHLGLDTTNSHSNSNSSTSTSSSSSSHLASSGKSQHQLIFENVPKTVGKCAGSSTSIDVDDRVTAQMSIVVACHSHAPLHEFWVRVPSPKLAIVMPCCSASYSYLPDVPILEFEDFEVYSPKRKICIYYTA